MILVFGYDNYYPGGGVNDLLWCGEEIQNFIDDIVDITIVKYDDGSTLIERDYDLFCGSGE